jgi:hypothetical protein
MQEKQTSSVQGPPAQVVVILKQDSELQPQGVRGLDSAAPAAELQDALSGLGVSLVPLFGESEHQVARMVARAMDSATPAQQEHLQRMNSFYTLDTPVGANAEEVAEKLNNLDVVEGAYVKPWGYPPVYTEGSQAPGSMAENGNSVPITQDLTSFQHYLEVAPGGIDARYAWTIPGGRGDGVNVIDIEGGWNTSHEDLLANSGGLINGFNLTTDPAWYQHGTAVLGEISGDSDSKGVTGIAPNARICTVSVFRTSATTYNSASAIRFAADQLNTGDVMLIEQHRGGPNYPGGNTQMGFIAIEWWPDDFLAIQYATSKGIIVVEAAGNGTQNLDAAVYDTPQSGFPAWWKNPFKRSVGMDSGAIIVGAGAPPSGSYGTDRSRLGFSNYGSCVDVQGDGNGVTTTGYGDITGTNAADKNQWYTRFFSGTSSASPIVTGACASLQGTQRAARRPLITPSRMRQLLRSTGTAQQASASAPLTQRIGNRPNLRQLIQTTAGAPSWCGVQFTGVVAANATQAWFTHSWPDSWQVVWTVVPTAPIQDGGAQIEFKVKVDRQAFGLLKYFIEITNLINVPVTVEARFCVLAS